MTRWLADNTVALFALAVAAVSLGTQLAGWHRNKARIGVTGHTMVSAPGGAEGRPVNHSFVQVTVRNLGRAISIEDIGFETVLRSNSVGWAVPDFPTALIAAEALPSHFSQPLRLAEGESRTWVCVLGQPAEDWPKGSIGYKVMVTLSTGKVVRSEPFYHSQTPAEGWREPDDDTGAPEGS